MSSAIEQNCTFLISNDRSSGMQQEDICKDLETNDIEAKIRGLKNAIFALLSNENMPRLLMTVIRFCITQDDHTIKKLLMLFWETVPKYSPTDKKLLPEMILVCNALRNDLLSPNEYVRGCMLRFLCKIKEPELLEPLIPAVKLCLEHRHSFVRRNAALVVYAIHRHFGEQLLPDGAELMDKFIAEETDVSARRNAFLMLFNEAESIAIEFLSRHFEDITTYGDGFALLVLELARKVCRRDPAQKARFVRALFALLRSESLSVSYEAAWTLVSLSSATTAVRAAAQTYTTVLTTSADPNVQLIVLDRLTELKEHHPLGSGGKVVGEVVMDILRVLSSPSLLICQRALAVALDLVSHRNLDEVVSLLRREAVRACESDERDREHAAELQALLVQALHRCAARYGEAVAHNVVLALCELLSGGTAAQSVTLTIMQCVRALCEQYPTLRDPILRKIVYHLEEISYSEALRVALWMCGEYTSLSATDAHTYTEEEPLLYETFEAVRALLGDPPFHFTHDALKASKTGNITGSAGAAPSAGTTAVSKSVVLADGTYATTYTSSAAPGEGVSGGTSSSTEEVPHLRRLLCGGDVLLGTVACVSLTKMALKALDTHTQTHTHAQRAHRLALSAAWVAAAVGRLAESKRALNAQHTHTHSKGVSVCADCVERLSLCVRVLLDPTVRAQLSHTFTEACQSAYSALVAKQKALSSTQKSKDSHTKRAPISRPDDLIQFRQLRALGVQGGLEVDLMDADDISRALSSQTSSSSSSSSSSAIQHVHQLTGYSDPVYVEATVTVHDYDVVLDMLVLNRTQQTLSNVCVELATIGDLRVLDRPHTLTLAAQESQRVRATVKVSSTETAHIFGSVAFESAMPLSLTQTQTSTVTQTSTLSQQSSQQGPVRAFVSLNDIQLDVMDYIRPPVSGPDAHAHTHCAPEGFRRMWAEFEWENKVAINSNIGDLYAFVQHIAQSTHMTVLTPLAEGDELAQSNFLAANLHARSVFGEDVLVNISVEKKLDAAPDALAGEGISAPSVSGGNGKLQGYIRIRSKTQGIALSLGDRITAVQRVQQPPSQTTQSSVSDGPELP